MMRILLLLGVAAVALASTALAQQPAPEDEKFVCKDSVDPRCMTE